MQSTRIAVVVGLGLVLLACSSTTIGTGGDDDDDTADGGDDAGYDAGPDASTSAEGGGDGSCSPGDPPSVYTYHPPLALQGSCSTAQVTSYVNVCGQGAVAETCDLFRSANPTCIACLESNQSDGSWGAVVIDTSSVAESANVAGCVVTLDDDAATDGVADCAAMYEDIVLCASAACEDSCDGLPYQAEQNCEQTALQTVCLSYVDSANNCVQNVPEAYVQSCAADSSYDYNDKVTAVANVLCVGP